jgi:hypothetical protein
MHALAIAVLILPAACAVAAMEFLALADRNGDSAPHYTHRNRIEKMMLPIWYLQLSWPETYSVSKEESKTILARLEHVVEINRITADCEGGNMQEFIARMDAA